MKKNISLLIIAAAAIAFSCSKEIAEPVNDGQAEQQLADQTFTATREDMMDNATKATFDLGIEWQVNDEIAISDGTTQSVFVATAVDDKGTATFSLKAGETPLATSGVTYKAWYPTSIAPDANGVMKRPQVEQHANGEIPSGKTINYAPSIYVTNPMYAESTTSTLSFKNLCGLLKIVYTGDGTPLLRQIFESYTEPIWGPYTIVDNTMVPSGTGASNGRTELKSTNSKYISQSGTDYVNTYYYAIPAGTYNSLAIVTFNNGSGDNVKCQVNGLKDGQKLTVERNKVYTIKIAINDLRKDLSREVRTANCYHFAGSGNYMFRATRGNEKEVIEGIDHVDVLWKAQTYNSTDLKGKIVDEKTITYKNGYVLFSGNGSQANAVVAAYDKSDNILWSWHIWSLNSARPLQDVTVNGLTMLDRNLGALYADKYAEGGKTTSILTAGYLYQWGRKDPFPGRGQEGSAAVIMKMMDKDNNPMGKLSNEATPRMTAPLTIDGPATVAQSIAHPDKFIKMTVAGHWASDMADTWGGDSKTIYDPCPYGYRVPKAADFGTYWVTANFTPTVVENSGNSRPSYHGFSYSDGTNTTFFPITGQLSWNSGAMSGAYLGNNNLSTTATVEAYGRMWTRDLVEGEGHTILQVRGAVGKGAGWDARASSVSTFNHANSYAMAVRCVKE